MQCCFAVILCEVTRRISLHRSEFTAIFKACAYTHIFPVSAFLQPYTSPNPPLPIILCTLKSFMVSCKQEEKKKKEDFIISARGLTVVIQIAFTVLGKGALYSLYFSVLAGTTVLSTTEGALSLHWLKADGLTHTELQQRMLLLHSHKGALQRDNGWGQRKAEGSAGTVLQLQWDSEGETIGAAQLLAALTAIPKLSAQGRQKGCPNGTARAACLRIEQHISNTPCTW